MKKRIVWIVLSVIMFLASILLILYYLWGNGYLWKAKSAPPAQTYAEFTYPSIDLPEPLPNPEERQRTVRTNQAKH